MTTLLIVAEEQATEPAIIEIIEPVDRTTRQRSRLTLIPARRIPRQSIHLKPDEYTIVPQKESGAQSR